MRIRRAKVWTYLWVFGINHFLKSEIRR
jgi:hypothetical protein